ALAGEDGDGQGLGRGGGEPGEAEEGEGASHRVASAIGTITCHEQLAAKRFRKQEKSLMVSCGGVVDRSQVARGSWAAKRLRKQVKSAMFRMGGAVDSSQLGKQGSGSWSVAMASWKAPRCKTRRRMARRPVSSRHEARPLGAQLTFGMSEIEMT